MVNRGVFLVITCWSTVHPQVVQSGSVKIVNNLWIKFMLLPCNDKNMAVLGLSLIGFLPTMNFQHSSCHRLLVQGASQTDAPFFMFHPLWRYCCSQYFQALRRSRWWITSEIFRSLHTLITASPHSQTDWSSAVVVCKTEKWVRRFLTRWISRKSVG